MGGGKCLFRIASDGRLLLAMLKLRVPIPEI